MYILIICEYIKCPPLAVDRACSNRIESIQKFMKYL